MHRHSLHNIFLSYFYGSVFVSEIFSCNMFCVNFLTSTPEFSAQLLITYTKNSFITRSRLLLTSTFTGPHICCHFDYHVDVNGPQDLPLTFMIYVPKGGKPKGTWRERNQMAITAKMSFCSGSYSWSARERATNSVQHDVESTLLHCVMKPGTVNVEWNWRSSLCTGRVNSDCGRCRTVAW